MSAARPSTTVERDHEKLEVGPRDRNAADVVGPCRRVSAATDDFEGADEEPVCGGGDNGPARK